MGQGSSDENDLEGGAIGKPSANRPDVFYCSNFPRGSTSFYTLRIRPFFIRFMRYALSPRISEHMFYKCVNPVFTCRGGTKFWLKLCLGRALS